ncbi:MAG: hypothetical protein R3Y10_12925 [Ferrimonas sp.]
MNTATEQQPDATPSQNTHGGAREGAGRPKTTGSTTKTVRLPERHIKAVKHLVRFLKTIENGEAELYTDEFISDDLRFALNKQSGTLSIRFEPDNV